MKTENNNSANALIAEFIGLNPTEVYLEENKVFSRIGNLPFTSNWNLLMEVVEKIETTSYKVPEKFQRGFMQNTLTSTAYINTDYDDREEFLGWSSYCSLGTKTIWDSSMLGEDPPKFKTKIEAVYNACVAFIEWYNENSAKEN